MALSSRLESFLAETRNVVVAGIRKGGRPQLSPNWFVWDGERFYISTTRTRVKYAVFKRDPRVELLVDDATGHRYVRVSGTVEVREDVHAELSRFRAIRDKHLVDSPGDDEFAEALVAEERVLLAITPAKPVADWATVGLD
jgi:PPOX class probable F420-dependent enzyme